MPAEIKMPTLEPDVSIIIVNTNDDRVIRSCLQSIETFEKNLSREIIIVDNNSRNDLSSELSAYSFVNCIRLEKNYGFTRANNIGISKASGKFILLLNPDTILTEPAITQCLNFFAFHSEKKMGALGCRLMNSAQEVQKSFYFSAASIYRAIQANAFFIAFFKNRIKKKWEKKERELHACISEVPWLCGAFILLRKDILIRERFFLDEDFFLYSDDVELGNRIRRRNYSLIYFPETSIIHLGSSGKNPWHHHFHQLVLSDWLCMMKIHGRAYFTCNQLMLLLNHSVDQLLFFKSALFRKHYYHELKSFLIRKKLMKLWCHHTLKILVRRKRTTLNDYVFTNDSKKQEYR